MRKLIILGILFIALGVFSIFFIDKSLACYFFEHDVLRGAFRIITDLGSFEWVFAFVTFFLILSYWVKSFRNYLFIVIVSLILADAASLWLKFLFGQARPILFLKHNIYGFYPFSLNDNYDALPSGHTLINASVSFSVYLKNKNVGYVLLVWSMLVAISRLVLYKHYLSNVLISFGLAIFIALISQKLEKAYTSS